MELLIGIGILILWALFVVMPRLYPNVALEMAYRKGDANSVEALLKHCDLNTRIALNVALGRYSLALAAAAAEKPAVLKSSEVLPPLDWLERINACEALVELGRGEEAVELLKSEPGAEPIVRAGRGTGLAWSLTCLGKHELALEALRTVTPNDLGPEYCAEAFLTQTLILLNLGRVDDAGKALDECRRLTVRASTERNVLLLEARQQVMSGRIDEGLKTFAAARDHRWKCQGGSSLLALGDALRGAGRIEEARSCWSLTIERDAESTWAAQAKERLQPA